MELCLQAPPDISWARNHHQLWARQTRLSSLHMSMLVRKSELHSSIRCSATEGGKVPSNEKQATEAAPVEAAPEGTSSRAANVVDSGSWIQGEGSSDPFFGWTSHGSQQSNANSAAGWIKIGGVIVLTLGFALGARSLYLKRDTAREFMVTPPATAGETAHSFSKATDIEETGDNLDSKEIKESSEISAQGSHEDTKQKDNERSVYDLQLEEVAEASQTGNINSHVVDESSIHGNSSPVASTDNSEEEAGVSETLLAADEAKLSKPKENAFTACEEDNASPVVGNADSIGENTNPLSTLADIQNTLGESDFSGTSTTEDLSLDESHLHGDDDNDDAAVGVLQREIPTVDHRENLATGENIDKATSQHDGWDGGKPSIYTFASLANKGFVPATITAPCTASDVLPSSLGEIVVPAPVDHMQEQILAALQALKVIEADVKPGDICTRREYARWLMASSATLTRSPTHKVLPAMFIENVSVLAYDDVAPEDADFSCIQGLAEAGLLSSRLLDEDQGRGVEEKNTLMFAPNSPLTRQDLVTWKVALERKPYVGTDTPAGLTVLKEKFGFLDLDKIHEDAWPALLVDISAGDQGIIALAFGHTRRLQPQKPVTKGQAAVALATGEAWELVSEELARLEAESLAEAAVVAEMALEAKAQKEVAAAFEKLLQVEREKQLASESILKSTQTELEQMKAANESEKSSLLRERAALEAEKELLSSARLEVEQQALALAGLKLEVAFQREQADKLHSDAEENRALISKVRSELEIEKNALILARSWAEDEARKAQAHLRALEHARRRWESQGIQVNVDKELDEVDEKVNSFSPSWQYSEGAEAQETPADGADKEISEELPTENWTLRADGLVKKSRELGQVLLDAVVRFLHFIQLVFHAIQKRAAGLFGKAGERFHEVRIKCADNTTKAVEGVKRSMPSSVAGLTSSLREGMVKTVDEWKGGAEKLSEKFKTS